MALKGMKIEYFENNQLFLDVIILTPSRNGPKNDHFGCTERVTFDQFDEGIGG